MICRVERAAVSDALVVVCAACTDDVMRLHLHAEVLSDKLDRAEYGEIGIPLAAPGSADFSDGLEGLCRHQIG